MQNDSRHKLPGFDYAQKAHIVTLEAIECVGEIKFHQHNDLASMPRGIDVLNGWCLATSWRTGSKLIWIEVLPQSVNAKRMCALRRQTPKRKADCNWANATRPGGVRRRRLGHL